MVKLLKNPCLIYTFLWCLYLCQGILYASGSISSLIAFFILILSMIYTCKYIYKVRLVGYTKALFSVLILVSLYGFFAYLTDGSVILGKVNNTPLYWWYKNMYLSILPIFTYLYFAKVGYLTVQNLKKVFPIIIVAVICSYYWHYQSSINSLHLASRNVQEIANNAGYVVLTVMPILIIFDSKRIIQYIGLFLIAMLVILSMKRGAILICCIMSLFFIMRILKNTSVNRKIVVCLLTFTFFILIYQFLLTHMMESDFFMARIEATKEGNSSGRDYIYSTLWNHFLSINNPFMLLFGGGVWYTTKMTLSAAHNDWLEFLLDMGIVGVLIYIYYWFAFYTLYRSKYLPEASKFCLFLIFINLFMKTLYSMSLETMTFIHGIMISLSYYGLLGSNTIKR